MGKPFKISFLATLSFLSALLLFSGGCSLNPAKLFDKKTNFAGIVTHESSSFTPTETGTLELKSEELLDRRNVGGSKTTFLWGLFTFTDY